MKQNGGPAFPLPLTATIDGDVLDTEDYCKANGGMSLRDWMVGQLLASGNLFDARDLGPVPGTEKFDNEARRIAHCCYAMVDAILEVREGQ